MDSSAERILYRQAALIFEELGFLMPQSEQGIVPQRAKTSVYISFTGPFSGCLLVTLNAEALAALSSNMLGLENEPDETLQEDALGEIANVICGNILPDAFGLNEVFRLAPPHALAEKDSARFESCFSRIAQISIPFSCGQTDIVLYADKE